MSEFGQSGCEKEIDSDVEARPSQPQICAIDKDFAAAKKANRPQPFHCGVSVLCIVEVTFLDEFV